MHSRLIRNGVGNVGRRPNGRESAVVGDPLISGTTTGVKQGLKGCGAIGELWPGEQADGFGFLQQNLGGAQVVPAVCQDEITLLNSDKKYGDHDESDRECCHHLQKREGLGGTGFTC